ITPSSVTSTAREVSPAVRAATSIGPERRVSIPTSTCGRGLPPCLSNSAVATPSSRAKVAVMGSCPATPRTPSVPKKRLCDIWANDTGMVVPVGVCLPSPYLGAGASHGTRSDTVTAVTVLGLNIEAVESRAYTYDFRVFGMVHIRRNTSVARFLNQQDRPYLAITNCMVYREGYEVPPATETLLYRTDFAALPKSRLLWLVGGMPESPSERGVREP